MNKLRLTNCEICGAEKTARGFSQHIVKVHNISLKHYIIKYVYNNSDPTCKCGCGKPVTIRGYDVMDYIDGHSPAGYFKKGESPSRDCDKWLKNLTKGIREYHKRAKEENPLYRSGENNNFFNKRHSEETRENIRLQVENQIASRNHAFIGNINGRIGKSSLETKFEQFLIDNNIEHTHNYRVAYKQDNKASHRYKYYDFYIPVLNKLIELHGSYWHPKQLTENLSEMLIRNYHNDQFKARLAKDLGYDLDVVYDTELDDYIHQFYTVLGERIDTEKLVTEYPTGD